MKNIKIQVFQKLLYLSQFVVNDSSIQRLVDRFLKLMCQFGIKQGDLDVNLMNTFNLLLVDLKKVQLKTTTEKVLAQTTRKFIKIYILLFIILLNANSLKKLILNVKPNGLLSFFKSFKIDQLHKVAVSISLLTSLIPLIKHLLFSINLNKSYQTSIASFLTIWSSISLFPNGFLKDYISVCSFFYGFESILNLLNDKYKLNVKSSWFLVPISLAELYHDYIIYPNHCPKLIKRFFDFLLKDLFETRSEWIHSEKWPIMKETIVQIRKISINKKRRISSVILHSQIKKNTKASSLPLYTNKLFSITNISESNLLRALLRHIPKKFITITLLLFPLFTLKSYTQGKFKGLSSKKILKEFLSSLKSTIKLSSTILFATITAFVLTIKNNGSHTSIKNIRIIGALAGLWSLFCYSIANKSLTTFFARIALLSTTRRLQEKYTLKYIDPLLGGIGFSILLTLYDNKLCDYISPVRITNYLKHII